MARLKKLKFNNTSYEFPVEDVKINTTSIVSNGVATIPVDSSVTASSTNLITSGAVSAAITGLGAGDVVGPASATSGNIAAFDGTTGKLIKDGGIATSAIVKTSGTQTINGSKTFGTSPVVPSKTSDATNTGTAIATEAQVYKKQDKLTAQTAYTTKGTATKVPTITTNTLGQVTAISETNITFPVTSVGGSTGAVGLKTVNGNSLVGSGNITISGGITNETTGTTSTVTKIWAGTEAQYTALSSKNANTIYFTF